VRLVECVPNFSEGRREPVIATIRDAAAAVPGVSVLDLHADAVHNRMVLTFVGGPRAVAEAAFRCVQRAAELIDLTRHHGEHPRMGATDVVPFVPVSGVTMDECVGLANLLGRRVGGELQIPVYLYARAARRPERVRLPNVRRGQYEGIRESILTDPDRTPDFGPARLGPAGATAIGARPFLVAYNVNLATTDLPLAKRIARSIRESSGGLLAVQALGMATADPNVVQVSTNLLDTSVTPLDVVFEAIRVQAAAAGVEVVASEIVGLVPVDVLVATTARYIKATGLVRHHALEAAVVDQLDSGDQGEAVPGSEPSRTGGPS
jgi:glutamate formiminotransferase / 5-formyltetrahydrofolate cyclo-ligase